MESPLCFAFVFPMASGHINPSLPIARALGSLGHEVHYLCREQMREAIEDTGAEFSNEVSECPELYEGRVPEMFGANASLKQEYNLEDDSMMTAYFKLLPISLELQLPGVLRWMRRVRPHLTVFCPLISKEAFYAAKILGIPTVPLLTSAGPGSVDAMVGHLLGGLTIEETIEPAKRFQPFGEAAERLESAYGVQMLNLMDLILRSQGAVDSISQSVLTLVTTCEDMQVPMPAELAAIYRESNTRFAFVGPLLDQAGAVRAGGYKYLEQEEPGSCSARPDPMQELQKARAAGRRVVLASMGTAITGDSPDFGWAVKCTDSQRKGLTGKQQCQAAWQGLFDAFGAKDASDASSPLILLALGPQPDALDSLEVPANALCAPTVPQVDLLRAGVEVFLTHGGQNSFMESLAAGVPMVVCPGFADQPQNAQQAVDMGVAMQVPKPVPAEGDDMMEAAAAYSSEVSAALLRVTEKTRFAAAAARCRQQIQKAGGVQHAVKLLLEAATATSPSLPTLLERMVEDSFPATKECKVHTL
ncbi:yojK [Symbiodinium sp. CCMP2592]|nr:yojK [Symbiodinium sp. CCMP2592]